MLFCITLKVSLDTVTTVNVAVFMKREYIDNDYSVLLGILLSIGQTVSIKVLKLAFRVMFPEKSSETR